MKGEVAPVANIGSRGKRRRLARGVALLAVGIVVVAVNLAAASRWWLVAVFALIFGGVLDLLQALGYT